MTTQLAHQAPGGEPGDEALAARLRDIEALTDAAFSRLDEISLLNALLTRVKGVLAADTATVLLADRSAGELVAAAASGIEEEVWQGVRVPMGEGFAGRVATERRPVILDEAGMVTVSNPLLHDRGINSLLGVPLLAGGRVIGVLHVGSASEHAFGPQEAELLRLAAERAALAVQLISSQDDRQAAVALHRSLMPASLPTVSGAELAARYVTGDGNVGGDWYDVFTLPGGQLGIVIGDVAGSGIQAAVIMGRMRSALRAYILETTDPAIALRKLDRKIQYFEHDAMATVLYGIYEPRSGQLTISSAGHLPPVLAVPGSAPDILATEGDVPIGVADDMPRQSSVITIPPGSLLCCYTDGLVERRDKPLDVGIGWLGAALGRVLKEPTGEGQQPPGSLASRACAAVMRELVGKDAARDDVAVVILHRLPCAEGQPDGASVRPAP